MIGILGIVAPVFIIILLGAAARQRRLVDAAGLRGINDVTFYLGLPALLFGAVIESAELRVLDAALLYFAICAGVFAIGVVVARAVWGAGLAQAGMVGLNGCYGNTVMVGVPVVSAAYGSEGLAVMLPIVALHSVLLLPLATLLIEAEGRQASNPWRMLAAVVPSVLRNPIIVAILAAFVWRLAGLPVPLPLHRLLGMLGAGAPALALFGLGATLPEFAAQGSLRETGLTTLLKLIVQPGLMWLGASLLGLGPLATAVAVITAGQPTGANAFFLARRTQTGLSASAGTVVVSTALSVVTLSASLALLR